MRSLRQLGVAVVLALLGGAALVGAGHLAGFRLHAVGVVLVVLAAVLPVWYAFDVVERGDLPQWPSPPIPRDVPETPPELRARRLQGRMALAVDGSRQATRDVAEMLADVVAARLVARHGADPADPLRDVAQHASAKLAALIATTTDPALTPPPLRRDDLAAFLKEIDAL